MLQPSDELARTLILNELQQATAGYMSGVKVKIDLDASTLLIKWEVPGDPRLSIGTAVSVEALKSYRSWTGALRAKCAEATAKLSSMKSQPSASSMADR